MSNRETAEPGWSVGDLTTIAAAFDSALSRHGRARAWVDYSGRSYTLGELDDWSTRLAHGLRAAGALHQQAIASVLDNCIEQIVIMLACAKIGAINVPLNTAYKGEFLRHQLADCGAVVLIAEREYVDRILAVADGVPEARVLLVKGEAAAPSSGRLEVRGLESAFADTLEPTGYASRPGDVAFLIYTAGTTGPSKGCMVSSNYACHMARQISSAYSYQPADVIWTPLPGFHLNMYTATVLGSLLCDARCAIYPRFSVSNFWPEIERTGATVTQILSTMISLIADMADNDAMKRCHGQIRVAAGAPFPPALQEKWKQRFGVKSAGTTGFGLTECALVTSCHIDDVRPPSASGRRVPAFDVRIVDDDDREVPPGVAGEIIVRPRMPHVMFEGYWRRPEATMAVLRNFWFHTGDIGKFDMDGWFYFVDRKKDYLRRRGENISSMELETTFRAHPAIAEVAVHAVFAEFEDDVKVTAVLNGDAAIDEAQLCRWCVDHLPYFAVPRFIEFRGELPKNPVGRVLKYQLRDEGITPKTWDREKADFELIKR